MRKALVVVDFENEWTLKKSPYYLGDISQLLARTNRLIDFCRKKGYRIIFTAHIEKGSKKEFSDGPRAEIISSLHRDKGDSLVKKNQISPFYRTTLEKELGNIRSIVICGVLTNLCVRSLAHDAYDRGFDIRIISDCCKAMDKKTHEFTLKDLKNTREEIQIQKLSEFTKK